MVSALLPLALVLQSAPAQDAAPVEPEAKEETNPAKMQKIFVTDSDAAERAKVAHPLQPICVRRLVPGSRVKARTQCQDKASWKAYNLAQDAAFYEWDSAQRGADVQ